MGCDGYSSAEACLQAECGNSCGGTCGYSAVEKPNYPGEYIWFPFSNCAFGCGCGGGEPTEPPASGDAILYNCIT